MAIRQLVNGAPRVDQRRAQRPRSRQNGRAQDAPFRQAADQIEQGTLRAGQIGGVGQEQHRQRGGFPDAEHVVIGLRVPGLHSGDVHGLIHGVEAGFLVVDGEHAEIPLRGD